MNTIARGPARSLAPKSAVLQQRALAVFSCCLLLACERGSSDRFVTVRDSAGITIVQNTGAAGSPELYTVAPSLTVDSAFGHIAGLAAGSDGTMFVLDQQAQQVRVFGPDGAFLRTLGRPGRGPGELSRFANAVLVARDGSIWVPDYAQSRVSVFAADGSQVQTIPLSTSPGGRSWTLTDAGDLVYRGISLRRDSLGQFQTWDALVRARPEAALDTILVFDYEKTALGSRENLRVPLIVNAALWTRLPDGRFAWSSLDRESIIIANDNGQPLRIVEYDGWNPASRSASRSGKMRGSRRCQRSGRSALTSAFLST